MGSYHLQRSSTNKLAPRTDLRGNALLLGQLLAHALSEEDSGLGLHEQRNTEVNGVPAHDVILVKQAVSPVLGQVKATANVVLLEDLTEGTLVLLRESDDLDLDALNILLEQSLDVLVGGKELVAKGLDILGDLDQRVGVERSSGDITTEEKTLTRLGQTEVHLRLSGCPVGLDEVFTKASHLASGGHFDTKVGVGTSQPSPGELRNLRGNVVTVDLHEVNGLGNLAADKSPGGNINKVGTENLADEGERTRCTKVALDDLEVGLSTLDFLLDDLHVERTGNVPCLGDLVGDLLDTLLDPGVKVDRGKDKCGVTRVDTSILNVLTDSVDEDLAVGGDSVAVNLLSAVDELGDDDGVVRGDRGGGEQLLLELVLAADDRHGSTRENVRWADEDRVLDGVSELLRLLIRGQLLPGGLVNTNGVEDGRELVTVLGLVNVMRVGSENLGLARLLEFQSNVLRKLATNGDNNTLSGLQLVNIHDTLVAQLFEVKPVSNIEISGVSLGILGVC